MATPRAVRPAAPSDAAIIKRIAIETGLFLLDEMDGFAETLSGFFEGTLAGHQWSVLEAETGEPIGATYCAPEPFSDRVWNLYFIGVLPDHQGRGAGGTLITAVEHELERKGEQHARILIVETSGLDRFDQTREFYRKHDFDEEARIRDYYGPGDDKVTFWKSLVPATP